MREQVRQHKEKAAGYLAKGKYKAAANQYLSALQLAPDDVGLRQKLGDIYSRMGERDRAIREYQHVAGRYAADGFLLKAMAICKVILNLDPQHTETQSTLAKLYATHRGEATEAVLPASMSGALRTREPPKIGRGLTIKPAARTAPSMMAIDPALPKPSPGTPSPSTPSPKAAPARAPARAAPPPVPSVAQAPGTLPSMPAVSDELLISIDSGGGAPVDDSAPPMLPADALQPLPPPLPPDALPVGIAPGGAGSLGGDADTETADLIGDDTSDMDAGSTLDQPTVDEDSLDLSVLASIGDASSAPMADSTGEVEIDMDIVQGTPVPGAGAEASADASVDEDLAEIDAQFARAEETRVSMSGVPPIPLFSQLDPEAFVLVFEHLNLKTVPAGVDLITEGERGSEMFIIVQGHVEVYRALQDGEGGRSETVIAEMADGAFFGEMALLADAPRMASVRTKHETAILVIDRDTLNHIAALHPSVAEVALAFYRERLLANLLRSNPLFQPFNDEEKQAIMDGFQSASIDEGVILLERGQEGDGLYLLLRGTCEVVDMTPDGKIMRYPDMKEGDVFGEISLLLGSPVTATVRTKSECLVLRLDRDTFYERIMAHPEVRRRITELTNERLKRTAELSSRLQMTATSVV